MKTHRKLLILFGLLVLMPMVAADYIDDVYYWQNRIDRKMAIEEAKKKAAQTVTITRKDAQQESQVKPQAEPAKKQSQVTILTPEAQRKDTVVKAVIKRNYEFGF